MNITFHEEEIASNIPPEGKIRKWLDQIAGSEGKVISQINYIFCTDEYLLAINKTYLDHDYYTDIITFPYKQGREIESDIFISIDRVADNAKDYGVSADTELLRVMAHGLLHLMGYGDKTDEDQAKMTEAENKCLDMWEKAPK